MQRIKVWNKGETEYIELPRDHSLANGGSLVYKEIEMAAGNLVQYIQGYRPAFSISFDYFPADMLANLIGLTRQGGWFRVEYPDTDGLDKEGYFKISTSQMGVFTYRNGVPVWRGLTLNFVSRELLEG